MMKFYPLTDFSEEFLSNQNGKKKLPSYLRRLKKSQAQLFKIRDRQ